MLSGADQHGTKRASEVSGVPHKFIIEKNGRAVGLLGGDAPGLAQPRGGRKSRPRLVASLARFQGHVQVDTAQDVLHVVRAVAGGGGARLQEPRPMLPRDQRRPKRARISDRCREVAWHNRMECRLERV